MAAECRWRPFVCTGVGFPYLDKSPFLRKCQEVSQLGIKTYADPAARTRSVERMAEHFGGLAVRSASESMKGSPLLYERRDFFEE